MLLVILDFRSERYFGYFFNELVTLMLPTKFQVNWPYKKERNRFSRWRPWQPSLISDRYDFSYFFYLQDTICFLPSFKSIGILVQEKKRKINFQDGGYLGLPIGTILLLLIYKSPPTEFQELVFLVRRSEKENFRDRGHGGHLLFPTGTILAFFYPQVTLMLPTMFQVSWPFGSEEEAKNKFSR